MKVITTDWEVPTKAGSKRLRAELKEVTGGGLSFCIWREHTKSPYNTTIHIVEASGIYRPLDPMAGSERARQRALEDAQERLRILSAFFPDHDIVWRYWEELPWPTAP